MLVARLGEGHLLLLEGRAVGAGHQQGLVVREEDLVGGGGHGEPGAGRRDGDAEVGRQGFTRQLLLVAGAEQRVGGVQPLQLQGAELGQRDDGDAGLLPGDGVQRVGRLLVALAHVQHALGAGQAEEAPGRLLGDQVQVVAELPARCLEPLVLGGLLPAVGIVAQQRLLVARDERRGDEVAETVGRVAGEIFAPQHLAAHVGLAAQAQHFLRKLQLGGGGEAVVVAQVDVVARDVMDYPLVVGRDAQLQLRLAQRLELRVLLDLEFIRVAALEGRQRAVLGEADDLVQALGPAQQRQAAQ